VGSILLDKNSEAILHILIPSNIFVPPLNTFFCMFLVASWLNLITHTLLCPISPLKQAPLGTPLHLFGYVLTCLIDLFWSVL
jgi:hypothetical protein